MVAFSVAQHLVVSLQAMPLSLYQSQSLTISHYLAPDVSPSHRLMLTHVVSHLLLQRVNVSLSGSRDEPGLACDVPIHCDHLSRWAETAVEPAQRDRVLPLDAGEFVTVRLFGPGYSEAGGRLRQILRLAERRFESTRWCDACHRALAPRNALATRPATASIRHALPRELV